MSLTGPEPGLELLLGVCGSSNAMNVPAYVFALRRLAPEVVVRVVLTRTAARIMPADTLRLVCDHVYCDGQDEFGAGHVALADRADLLVVLPATANVLGQAAHGLSSGLLTSVLLAHARPVYFFPCMNGAMWERPAVRRNVALLRDDGHHVVEPVPAASWVVGSRRLRPSLGLPQPEAVAALLEKDLAPRIERP